ncbi:MAG: DEAD/DEAH box helicase, partial [Micrococcales bacterium]|nr:DEAD/DEAH box helicase [Micrococcales bacterium]
TWADPDLVAGYRALGVQAPWCHQVEAAQAVHDGHHTVVATSTGSGKSLGFWLPALTAVGEHATTLYIAPTKALAADQVAALHRLVTAAHMRVDVAACDGDTPSSDRRWVREHADVVATNPDFLHFSLLPGHRRWARFLARLRYVVVDECHAFRGVFGAHIALVLRRLRRVAAAYGADPVFVCASATTSAPQVSAARLVGVAPADVVAVTDDTSPAGPRTIVCWRPQAASATGETAELLADLVAADARVLAFCRSRRGAETVAATTRDRLGTAQVRAYRGGYLPEERRALEQALRDGSVRALATTNALELGIDITGLDAVLVAGFPGTRVSWWQQAGRAGRAGAAGLVVLVAREDPLDAYLVANPHALLDAPVEPVVFDPDNPAVLAGHLAAAAAEVPVIASEVESVFGPSAQAVLDELADHGVLRRRGQHWYWTHAQPATQLSDLRGGGRPVQVVEAATGQLLGTVDSASADATCHAGAVYVHQGATFVVEELVHDEQVALVTACDVDWRTWARWTTDVDIVEVRDQTSWGPVTWAYGIVDVTTQVVSFLRRRVPDLTVISSDLLDLPQRHLRTAAVWWSVDADTLETAGLSTTAPGALHAAEHASIGLLPLLATCDRGDLGGLSTLMHAGTGQATVFVHESFYGGAGFTRRGFDLGATWLRATRDAIAGCPCPDGCPSCVHSPKCGNANEPLDKPGAVRLLDLVLREANVH